MLLKSGKLRVSWIWLKLTCDGIPGRSIVVSWMFVVSLKESLFPKCEFERVMLCEAQQ